MIKSSNDINKKCKKKSGFLDAIAEASENPLIHWLTDIWHLMKGQYIGKLMHQSVFNSRCTNIQALLPP